MSGKPSEKEEEYFKRMEFERLKKIEEEKHAHLVEDEKKQLRDLHFRHCPKCGMSLIETGFRGVKVDKCSACEGIWLDAGEINQILSKEEGFLTHFFHAFKK